MVRFRWTKPAHDAERAVVAMAYLRAKCQGVSSEEAVLMTLPYHCRNPEAIPVTTFIRLCRRVDKLCGDFRRKEARI